MVDELLDKIYGRDSFLHVLIIFMPIVVKNNHLTIVAVNSGGGNGRASEIASYIFDYIFRIAFVRFWINIEVVFMFRVLLLLF